MTHLENLLATTFSNDTALSNEGIKRSMQSIRHNPDQRELDGICKDVKALVDEPNTDWIELLFNEHYEVALFGTQDEAKIFIIQHIWNGLCR